MSVVELGIVEDTAGRAAVLLQPPARSTFRLEDPDDGSFIQFTARLIPAKITDAGEIPVSVADVEDVLIGNIYDHEGAD